jgi:RHS repeat-associated protein
MATAVEMADNARVRTYAYNGHGLRDSRTVGEGTVTFTWDIGRSVPQIIDDGSLAYVYGLGRISQVASDDTTFYHLSDGLASTMALTDASGNVVNTYDYDVFGSVSSQTGSQPNEFQFTGEQVDSTTALQYLRARYYDPTAGRFLSRDPFAGLAGVPQSLNRYPYVLNNPVLYRDPYGYWGLGDVVDKARDVGGAIGCGIKTGAEATAQVADWARDQAVSAGAWLATCDWKQIAGGAVMLGGAAVAFGTAPYVIGAAAAGAPLVFGVGTVDTLEGIVAGEAIATGGAALGVASLVPFSHAGCGEDGNPVPVTSQRPRASQGRARSVGKE